MAWCGVAAADADGQQGGQDSQLVVGDLSAWLDTSFLLETSDVRPAYIGARAQDWRRPQDVLRRLLDPALGDRVARVVYDAYL